jgi:hypothetical protein
MFVLDARFQNKNPLYASKTRDKPVDNDFDRISQFSASTDRGIAFFQRRQQNRKLNTVFNEADILNR